MRLNSLFEIRLADADIKHCQLMKTCKIKNYDGSEVEITPERLRQLKASFDNNVRKTKLAIDYFHASYNEAAGWIEAVTLENGDTEMWIDVEWTPIAEEKIRAGEIKYLSADFNIEYEDEETGQRHDWVLNGGGLTNRPRLKGMAAILSEFSDVDLSEKQRQDIKRILSQPEPEQKTMNFDDLKKEVFALGESQKQELIKLCGGDQQAVKLGELNKELDDAKKKIVQLSTKLANQEKEAEFAVMLSEGKAVEAQKDAYMQGDMKKFLDLAQPVNLAEKGNGAPPPAPGKTDDIPATVELAEVKIIELAEAKLKENTALDYGLAVSLVLSENPKLAVAAGY